MEQKNEIIQDLSKEIQLSEQKVDEKFAAYEKLREAHEKLVKESE